MRPVSARQVGVNCFKFNYRRLEAFRPRLILRPPHRLYLYRGRQHCGNILSILGHSRHAIDLSLSLWLHETCIVRLLPLTAGPLTSKQTVCPGVIFVTVPLSSINFFQSFISSITPIFTSSLGVRLLF